LLIFDDGNFSEDETFLLTDWLAHTPKDVLSKNFRIDKSFFMTLSEHGTALLTLNASSDHAERCVYAEKYIFRGTVPGSLRDDKEGLIPSKHRFTHKMLDQKPLKFPGGEVRITDSSNFPIATTTAAAHVIINPHALRELHWHPNADEWSYFIRGRARITIFASGGSARTFNYQAGDVGIVPKNMPHYVENLGDEPVHFLEMFRASRFQDFSLEQWLAQTPPTMVAEHMNISGPSGEKFLKSLSKEKIAVKAPFSRSKSMSDFSGARL